MRILELAVQGVPGRSGVGRLRPEGGLTVVPDAGLRLAAILGWGLFDATPGPARDLLAAGSASGRLGLTLRDGRGRGWRLYRDLGSGGARLQRWDATRKGFTEVTAQAAEAIPLLRSSLGLPAQADWSRLYRVGPDEGPSPSTGVPARAQDDLDPEVMRVRLGELQAALERARAREALQYELDGVEQALADGEARLRESRTLAKRVADLESEARSLPEVPDDLEAMIEAEGRAVAQRDRALAAIEARRAEAEAEAEAGPGPSPWRDPWLAAGTAGALGILGLAGALPSLRGLAALAPVAGGAALWGVWRWTGDGRRADAARAGLDELEARRAAVLAEHEVRAAPLRRLLTAFEVDTPEALRERLAEVEHRRGALEAARRKSGQPGLQATERVPDQGPDLETQRQDLLARIEAMGPAREGSVPSLEREIARLRARVAPVASPWGDLEAPVEATLAAEATGVAGGGPEAWADLEALARLTGGNPEELAAPLLERATAVLDALAPGRGLRLGWDGRRLVTGLPEGRSPDAEVAAVTTAAWSLAVAGAAVAARSLPVVVESRGWLPDFAAPGFLGVLEALAERGQVLHLTDQGPWMGAACPVASLEGA